MSEPTPEIETPQIETPETETETRTPEAAEELGRVARVVEQVRAAGTALEAHWAEALTRARGLLDRAEPAPLTRLQEQARGLLRATPVVRAQQRGAGLLLSVVSRVRSSAERVEENLRAVQVEVTQDEVTEAAA